MRLPPPPRRYSPISVMAVTPETVSRPNSRSIAARSSRRSSKTSRPLVAVVVLTAETIHRRDRRVRREKLGAFSNPRVRRFFFLLSCFSLRSRRLGGSMLLVAPVIRELHIDSEILLFQKRDYFLQTVAVFAADSHYVGLDGGLNFLF